MKRNISAEIDQVFRHEPESLELEIIRSWAQAIVDQNTDPSTLFKTMRAAHAALPRETIIWGGPGADLNTFLFLIWFVLPTRSLHIAWTHKAGEERCTLSVKEVETAELKKAIRLDDPLVKLCGVTAFQTAQDLFTQYIQK